MDLDRFFKSPFAGFHQFAARSKASGRPSGPRSCARLGVVAQFAQGAHAADAQDDLLGDAQSRSLLYSRAVSSRSLSVAFRCRCRANTAGHAPDLNLPQRASTFRPAARPKRSSVSRPRPAPAHRQVFKRMDFVAGFLPAVFGDALGKVALGVEEPDATNGRPRSLASFQVVAREHAQPAGVDRQGLVQAEFGGEIGDSRRRRTR
jgi:hypothetical protein